MRGLALVVLILTLAACGGRSNVVPPEPLERLSEPLAVSEAWRADIAQGARRPDFQLGPEVVAGRVYFADAYGTIHGRRADDGHNLWRVHLDKQLSAGPAADTNLALVGTTGGEVLAFDAETGEARWQAEVSSEVIAPPRIAGARVFVRTIDGLIFALDRDDGSRLWTFESSVPSLTLRGTSRPAIAGGDLFVGFDNGRVKRLDAAAGEVVWAEEIAAPRGRSEIERMVDVDAGPVIGNGAVYAGAYQRRFRALSLRSGDDLWTRELSVHQAPALDESRLYVADDESVLWSLEQRSGETLWRNDSLRGRRLTAPVIHGEYIAVGDLDGYVHWISRDSGRIRARVQVDESAVAVAPAAGADDLLFVQSLEGTVAAYALPDS